MVTSMGRVTVRFDNGFVHTLKKVRYIPHMERNLILMGELERIGFTSALGDEMLKIFNKHLEPLKLLGTLAFTSCMLK